MATKPKSKSTVNAAGNYTKPEMRKRIFNSVKAAAVQGTGAGQWSLARHNLLPSDTKPQVEVINE
jgi:hypothetical protein